MTSCQRGCPTSSQCPSWSRAEPEPKPESEPEVVPYLKRHRVPATDWDALCGDVRRMTFCVRTVGAIRLPAGHSTSVCLVCSDFSQSARHKLKIDRNCDPSTPSCPSDRSIDSPAVEFSYERLISAKLHTCNFKMLQQNCWSGARKNSSNNSNNTTNSTNSSSQREVEKLKEF